MNVSSVLWRGSVAVAGGRLLMSLGRLLLALLIARLAGVEELGAFVLLLSLLGIFEWLADFGQTDIAVREIAAHPEQQGAVVHALARAKLVALAPLALALPVAAGLVARDWSFALAALLATPGILALCLLQPCRAQVRSQLRPWLDIGSEVAGFSIFLIAVTVAAGNGGRIELLGAAYSLFRIVQAVVVARLAPPVPRSRGMQLELGRQALPLGLTGLLVALYDNLGPILLLYVSSLSAVAMFGAAARFAFPVIMVVQAITTAFFPALAAHRSDPAQLARLQQSTLEACLVVAGILFAVLHGAADMLVGLLGEEFLAAAPLLRMFAWLVLARAVTTAMSPLVVIGGWQARGFYLTLLSVAVQATAILLLVPRIGIIGVGWGYLVVELTLGTIPVTLLALRATGVRLRWGRPALILACAAATAGLVALTPWHGQLAGGLVAAAIVASLFLALGLVPVRHLRTRWQSRAAGALRL